jgi:phosphoglycolate phosphatase
MPAGRRRFDLLVFDWDGTLMDSAAAITLSLQSACRDLDFPVPAAEQARYVIGLGLDDAMAHILPDLDPSHYPRVRERYRHHFLANDAGTSLFSGAGETIAALHAAGFLLGVATGKSRRGLDRALEATRLQRFFHASRCADEAASKPHPAMLLELMEELDVVPERTLMIGDTTHDMGMARAAGVARLAAAYGAHARPALLDYEPVACAADFGELRAWLEQNA